MEYIQTIITTLLSVVILFFMAKLLGGKQISQLSLFDYINGITIGSIGAELATGEWEDNVKPLIALILYIIVAFLINLCASKSIKLRRFMEGRSLILFKNGKFIRNAFCHGHIDVNEFLIECRINGFYNLDDIDTAVLESNGKISFLPKAKAKPVTPADLNITTGDSKLYAVIISDGKVLEQNLKSYGYNEEWLKKQLQKENYKQDDIFLAVCDREGNCCFYPSKNIDNKNDLFQ